MSWKRPHSPAVVFFAGLFFLHSATPLVAEVHDLRSTPTARRLEEILPSPGNEGKSSIHKFEIDTGELELRIAGSILARHHWGTIAAPTFRNPRRRVDVAAQKTVEFTFGFNLKNNTYTGSVSLGRVQLSAFGEKIDLGEIKIDSELIENLLTEDLHFLLNHFPNPAPDVIRRENKNEYMKIRNAKELLHGADNVYFASERFVTWASPETVGRWVVSAVLTSGASLEAAMKEAEIEARKEKDAIVEWLQSKTNDAVDETVEKILTGQQVTGLPNLALKWRPIRFESEVYVLNQPTTGPIAVNHGAFYLVWTGPGGSDRVDDDFPDPNDPNAPGVETNWNLGLKVYYKVKKSLVTSVTADSPADRAGIKKGDVIFRIGNELGGLPPINEAINRQAEAGVVKLRIGQTRNGVYEVKNLDVDLR